MPGDAVNSGIGFLDVQFGALEFGSDSSSLDGSANEKYNSANNTISGVDMTSGPNAVNTANTSNSLDIETTQTSTTPYNASSQMVNSLYLTLKDQEINKASKRQVAVDHAQLYRKRNITIIYVI